MNDMASLGGQPAGVRDVLDRLEQINRQLGETAARGSGSGAAIVSLRHDFAMECGNLLMALCADPQVFENRALFSSLQDGLDVLRSRVTNHQLRWQGDRIEAERASYASASRSLGEAVEAFIAETRAAIGG